MTYRVLIVEPLDVCRRMLIDALAEYDETMTVVAETSHASNAPEIASRVRPNVIVLTLDDRSVLDQLEELRKLDSHTKVVVLSLLQGPEILLDAIRRGAIAFLPQNAEPEAIVDAIMRAARGEQTIDVAAMTETLKWTIESKEGKKPLSERERAVLNLLSLGLSASAISERLWISRRTVESHLSSAYRKLGVSGRIAALQAYDHYRRRHGLGT